MVIVIKAKGYCPCHASQRSPGDAKRPMHREHLDPLDRPGPLARDPPGGIDLDEIQFRLAPIVCFDMRGPGYLLVAPRMARLLHCKRNGVPVMPVRCRRFSRPLAAALLACLPAAASAAPAGFSSVGPGLWRGGPASAPGWTAPGVTAGFYDANTVQIDWSSFTAGGGYRWSMGFDTCATPGSKLESLDFNYFRASSSTSPYYAFTANYGGGDHALTANLRDLGQGPISIPADGCAAELRLLQGISAANNRDQTNLHTYLVGSPSMIVRDIEPPTVAWRAGAGQSDGPAGENGWIRGGATQVLAAWQAGDNFGSEGIGEQRVIRDGQVAYAGSPGVGNAHGTWIDLPAGLADGQHTLDLQADAPSFATVGTALLTIKLDRTPPTAAMTVTPSGPARYNASTTASDATSGVGRQRLDWIPAGGGAVALMDSSQADFAAHLHAVDLAAMADTKGYLRLTVTDGAGNDRVAQSPLLAPDALPPSIAITSTPNGPARWKGESVLQITAQDNRGQDGIGRLQAFVFGNDATLSSAGTYLVGPGSNEVRLIVPSGTTDGRHRVRLVLCDPVVPTLCSTNESVVIVVGAPPVLEADPSVAKAAAAAQSTQASNATPAAAVVYADASGLRSSLRLEGAKARIRTGHGLLVVGRAHITLRGVSGRLDGPGFVPGLVVTLRTPAGRAVGHTSVTADGAWRLGRTSLRVPGVWNLTVGNAPHVRRVAQFTAFPTPDVMVTTTFHGKHLHVAGILAPGVSGKQVVLEWREPTGKLWRPVVIGRTTKRGTFTLDYPFRDPRVASVVQMRVSAPSERGIPLAGAVSRAFIPAGRLSK